MGGVEGCGEEGGGARGEQKGGRRVRGGGSGGIEREGEV